MSDTPASTPPPAPTESATPSATASGKGTSKAWIGLVVAAALGLGVGLPWYQHSLTHESTDDAFVDGRIVPSSSQISGTVKEVAVRDNQEVKQGDLLLTLDEAEHRLRVAKAEAALEAATRRHQSAKTQVEVVRQTSQAAVTEASSALQASQSSTERTQAQVASAHALLTLARTRSLEAAQHVTTTRHQAAKAQALLPALMAEVGRTTRERERFEKLLAEDEVSLSQCERVRVASDEARARYEAARQASGAASNELLEAQTAAQAAREAVGQQEAAVREAEARVREAQSQAHAAAGRLEAAKAAPEQTSASRSQAQVADAGVREARATLEQARLDLSHCRIVAPMAGRVTRKAVEAGVYVQPGQALLSIVPHDVWVLANFKETQLRSMKVGQKARVRVDAFPDRVLAAHIESLQAGTGSRFSLLPTENASGNYVKVVQRVPVKLVFDEPAERLLDLSPGMSVEPVIELR